MSYSFWDQKEPKRRGVRVFFRRYQNVIALLVLTAAVIVLAFVLLAVRWLPCN